MPEVFLTAVNLPLIGTVELSQSLLLVFFVCLLAVVGFEIVNGFHDTANAVATVIYTNTLRPYPAIIWSGFCNFLGVFVIGTAVAMSLLQLVPLDRLVSLPGEVGAGLVLAILLASIIWNLSTWYVGLPLSSSHTLIGAMIGASIGFSMYYGGSVNWEKAKEIGLSLLLSPLIGFVGSALLMQLEKRIINTDEFFHAPENEADRPPTLIRILLITTCTLVSFFHGSNDGQKGVGLLMLVLIAFLPARFMLNPEIPPAELSNRLTAVEQTVRQLPQIGRSNWAKTTQLAGQIQQQLRAPQSTDNKPKFAVRRQVQTLVSQLRNQLETDRDNLPASARQQLESQVKALEKVTDFAPLWVLFTISLSLGIGTTIGWKRIVVTIGERIGREHLNYAEGATAEVVAAGTIGLSTLAGLPVSTTHVLSSGVAGAMTASGGAKNLNYGTLRNIAIAWLLTLPVAIVLALLLFMFFHWLL